MARWSDIFFNMSYDVTDTTVPNPLLLWLGFYGEHWEYTNPQRTEWTFLARPDGSIGGDGTDRIDWAFLYENISPGWNLPVGVYLHNVFADGAPMYLAKQHTNVAYQMDYRTTDTQFPPLARQTQEEIDSIATMQTELEEYCNQSFAMFMSGQTELSDANWDAFIARCKVLGSDTITEVRQNVLTRWNAAMK